MSKVININGHDIEVPDETGAMGFDVEDIIMVLCALDIFQDFLEAHKEPERAMKVEGLYWKMVEGTKIPMHPKKAVDAVVGTPKGRVAH
jgi:hypothetical protein